MGRNVFILIQGKAGTGKDSLAKAMSEALYFHNRTLPNRTAFTKPMKDLLMRMTSHQKWRDLSGKETSLTRLLYGDSALRQATFPGNPSKTLRTALQELGDWGRSISPLFWVEGLFRSLENDNGVHIITDARFISELEYAKERYGNLCKTVRLTRTLANAGESWRGHSSETEMDSIPSSVFDHEYRNDGTLEDLYNFGWKVLEDAGLVGPSKRGA